jgi:alpha-L-fucosidase 2
MKYLYAIIILLSVLTSYTALAESPRLLPKQDLKRSLWYKNPAEKWSQALPVGNGRLGGMVFGGVERERLQLNEESVWSRDKVETDRVGAYRFLPEIREMLFAGRPVEAEELVKREVLGPRPLGSYQTLGDLTLEFPGVSAEDYVRWLDVDNGIASVRFRSGDNTFHREVFVSPVHDVIVVQLSSDQPGKITCSLGLTREEAAKTVASGVSELRMTGVVDAGKPTEGVRFVAGLRLMVEGGEVRTEDGRVHVRDADRVMILITAATDYAGGSPETRVDQTLGAAAKLTYDELKSAHIASHQSLMQRVSLDLGDGPALSLPTDERLQLVRNGGDDPGLLALYFQYGRYLLVSSSRSPGILPANLQGIWNENINPYAFSGWHLNIDAQMNYWPAETANLSETHTMFIKFLDRMRKNGRRTARDVFGARGFVVSHRTNAALFTSPVKGGPTVWPLGAAWSCQHVWEHYAFSGDKEYLRSTGYPILKEASEFLLDWLVPNPVTQELVSGPSISPENSYFTVDGLRAELDMGPAMDQQITAELFDNTLSAAADLGIEDEFTARVRLVRGKLAPTRIASDGRIMEWSQEFKEREPHHRHVSHLYAVYPGNAITPRGTPDLAEAARKSLQMRTAQFKEGNLADEQDQLSEGQFRNHAHIGNTGWSLAHVAGLWARLGDGDQALSVLRRLLRNATFPNLMDTHPIRGGEGATFLIDGNLGGVATIAEMLLQSHAGEIDLLPALPTAWATGSVKGLRARGGLTVDIAWQDGKLAEAELRAGQADTVRIRVPGRAGVFRHEESLGVATASDPLDVATQAGDVLKIRPL